MILLVVAACALSLQTARIENLDLSQIHQGWGKPMRDRSVTDTPLSIAGAVFEHGLGTHADSSFKIKLDGNAREFHAFCGVDDNCQSAQAGIVFRVVGDGKELWKSPMLSWKQPAVEAAVPLSHVRILTLEANRGREGIDYDHADWAEATIQFEVKPPIALVPEIEKPYILTPPPPRQPRINGPTIYGVRPGSPFLYAVPATGDRPMRFSARGLPDGLSIDANTGFITGSVAKNGEYHVELTAKNLMGSNRRLFRIKCGVEVSLTPQMGWNSWYVWTDKVSDQIMRAAADAMVSTGLSRHGWQFVDIDDCWARIPGSKDTALGTPTRDSESHMIPNAKFPDMRALTDYIHSKGLKAGIYTSPGKTTCAGYEGAFGHEALDARTFADWGFDLLKYDWCSYTDEVPNRNLSVVAELEKPYRLMGGLLKQQQRDIVLNLCQYGMGKVWTWGKEVGGTSWRTADDLGAGFTLFRDSFDLYAREPLDKYAGPGAYNDPDYLLLGKLNGEHGLRDTPFTPNEQYTQVSMWCLLCAPLVLSGDITQLDPFTLSLLTNDDVLAVDQDALVKGAHRVAKIGETEVWAKPMEDGGMAVGLFNLGDEEMPVEVNFKALGLVGKVRVRDLWRQKNLGTFDGLFQTRVGRHGVVLVSAISPSGRPQNS